MVQHNLDIRCHGAVVVLEPVFYVFGIFRDESAAVKVEKRHYCIQYGVVPEAEITCCPPALNGQIGAIDDILQQRDVGIAVSALRGERPVVFDFPEIDYLICREDALEPAVSASASLACCRVLSMTLYVFSVQE